MKRTTIFLDPALERDLQLLAERDGRSTASVVREALSEWVAERKTATAPRLGFVAAGRSGTTDTAERHETLLFEEGPHGAPRRAPKPSTPRKPARRRR